MPYAAPSPQAKTMYQAVGPGRCAQLDGHSSTAPAAGFSRGEPHHPDISMEWAAQLNSTRERSDNNRFAPLSSPPSPIHRSRSGASTRYRRIDDSDIEYDSVSASGSDGYMSLDSWSEDDTDFEMATGPGRPLSREPSASNQTGFESHIPPNLFSTPNFNYTGHTTAPFSAHGSIGTTPYTEIVRRGDRESERSSEHASREPVWGRNAHSASRAPPMCTICKVKPAYRGKGGASYPTCGLTCASKLEENKKAQHSRTGPAPPTPGKCVVCKDRDVHVSKRTGRPYPTCGLNCASALKPSGAEAKSKCDLCHKREKAVSKLTGKPYEYCGRECRDKAKNLLEEAIAGTCRTCLVCWSSLGPNADLPTCGARCHRLTEALAPTIIEIPRGHVLFDKYNRRFRDGWGDRGEETPTVQHTYYFVQNHGATDPYTKYKGALEAASYGQKPVEQEFWVTVGRECSTGTSGDVGLCPSYSCLFCDVVRNGFQAVRVPGGLKLARRSYRAHDNLKRGGMFSSTKVMMFVRLIRPTGRKAPEVTFQQVMTHGHDMRRDHPVVNIVEYNYGRRVETGDVYVFEPAAIRLLGCVVYA